MAPPCIFFGYLTKHTLDITLIANHIQNLPKPLKRILITISKAKELLNPIIANQQLLQRPNHCSRIGL